MWPLPRPSIEVSKIEFFLEVNTVLYIREEPNLIARFDLTSPRIELLHEDILLISNVAQVNAELLRCLFLIHAVSDLKVPTEVRIILL